MNQHSKIIDGIPSELPQPWREVPMAVVVPTYNEAGNLPELARRIFALGLSNLRLIIADDDSPDGTGDLADQLAEEYNQARPGSMHVVHRKIKEGIGRAHIAGMKVALSLGDEYVVQMDGDLSHIPEFIPAMLGAMLATDAGLVIGSRYVVGGSLSVRWGLHRRLLSKFATKYVNTILHLGIRDVTGGFKIWRRDVLEELGLDSLRSDGYSFQVEMNYLCKQAGYKILEVPIHFEERNAGTTKINSFAVQFESMKTPFVLLVAHRGAKTKRRMK